MSYSAPPNYPPPPPSAYTPQQAYYPPPPPKNDTKEGVKFMHYALLLAVVTVFVGFVSSLPNLSLVGCFSGLVGLVLLILFLMGIHNINKGKNEFPEPHATYVGKANMFLVLAIIVIVVSAVVSVGMALSSIDLSSIAADEDPTIALDLKNTVVIASFIGIFSALFIGLMFKSLIEGIATPESKDKTRLGLIILLIGALVSLILTVALYPSGAVDVENMPSNIYLIELGTLVNAVGYLVLYSAYKDTFDRLESGALKPRAPQQPPMSYGAPQYPPASPPNYPPPPPPTYPPQ